MEFHSDLFSLLMRKCSPEMTPTNECQFSSSNRARAI
jgi:hypothetical protein